ncbi:MAG: GEVED domain-containing protein, partial [Bacteroidota bacterium]
SYTSIALNINGWICMGTVTPFSSYTPISTGSASNVISFFSRDLQLGPYQTCTTTSGSSAINLTYPAASNYFLVGDTISGTGIPLNASVTAISAGNMTISAPATSAGTSIYSKGYVSYQVSGVTPNKVFTIQWRRFGRWSNSSTGLDDYLNTQIKLYETSNIIEVIYGNCGTNSTNAFTGEIGLRGLSNADFNNRSIVAGGAYNASNVGSVNSASGIISSTLAPTSGQIYRWTPPNPCAGAPSAGIVSPSSSICPNTTAVITNTSSNSFTGITYQWWQAPSAIGPWTNVTTGSGFNTQVLTTASLSTLTFYQLVITCTNSAQSASTAVTSVNPNNPANLCYCVLNLGGSGCTGDNITNVSIINTTFNNNSNCNTNATNGTYTQFPPSPSTTATLSAGVSYSLSVTTTANNIESVWIDFDQNGIYDPSEHTQICLTSVPNIATVAVFNVPITASLGQTGMRVRSRGTGNPNGPTDPCTTFGSGETEDYVVTIVAGTPCAGNPAGNSAVASSTNVCPGGSTNLSLANSYTVGGLIYQWSTATNSVGPYSSVIGATTSAFTATNLTVALWYQCVITCTNGPASTTATPVQILVGGSSCQCAAYCASAASSNFDDEIFNVNISTLNNTSNCSQTGNPATSTLNLYSNYAGIIASPNLAINSNYTLNVTVGQCNASAFVGGVTVYMDFNQNGSFGDPGEQVFVSASTLWAVAGTLVSTVITIPSNASLGTTRMRVIAEEGNTGTADCASYTWGETEDYCINITAGCAAPNVTLAASQTTICSGTSVGLVASGATTYTWNTSATTSSISVTPSVTTSYTVVGENIPGCPDTKTVNITVNPSPNLTVSPSPTICPGATATMSASGALSYTWNPGSFTTSAVSVTAGISTVYNVVGTNSVGCSTNSNVTVFVLVCTGIANGAKIDNTSFIYPNPNNGNINVVIENGIGNYSFEIFDIAGKLVYKTMLNKPESTLNIKELVNGLYAYKITSALSKTTIKQGKLIKE